MKPVTTLFYIAAVFSLTSCSGWEIQNSLSNTGVIYHQQIEQPPYHINFTPNNLNNIRWYPVDLGERFKTVRTKDRDCEDYGLRTYLAASLPLVNNYLKIKLGEKQSIQRPLIKTGAHLAELTRFGENGELRYGDLPEVHFGDPHLIVENYGRTYLLKYNSVFTVVNGSEKWKSTLTNSAAGSLLVDIRIGLIQVTPTNSKTGLFTSRNEHKIGTKIAPKNPSYLPKSSPIEAINVIAFKGISYTREGKIVNAAVEGVIPIYPWDSSFDILGLDDSILAMGTDELDAFPNYPWQQAPDNLLGNLLASKN